MKQKIIFSLLSLLLAVNSSLLGYCCSGVFGSISRLHSSTMITGQPVKASDVNDELNQVLNAYNNDDCQLSSTISSLTGSQSTISTIMAGYTSNILNVASGGTGSATPSGARSNLGAAALGANSDITSLSGLTTPLTVGQGGTGSATASGARTNLSAAASGSNSDITSLSALSTPLSVLQGGTGQSSYTNGQLLIGNTTGSTLTPATLTAGTGISVTNGTGSITISATSSVPAYYNQTAIPVYSTGTALTVANINCADSTNTILIAKSGPTTINLSNTSTGLNGIAQSATLTGTIAYNNASASVTGTSTTFTTDLIVGDTLYDSSNGVAVGVVKTITNNTSLTLLNSFSGTSKSGASYKRGSLSANAWEFLYAITNGTTPGFILSNRSVAGGATLVDLPSGYTTYRQLSFAIPLNSSSQIINFTVGSGWPKTPLINYNVNGTVTISNGGDNSVLSSGSATTWTTVSLSNYVPTISNLAFLSSATNGSQPQIRTKGSGLSTGLILGVTGSSYMQNVGIATDSSQNIEYENLNTGSLSLGVTGFVVNQVP